MAKVTTKNVKGISFAKLANRRRECGLTQEFVAKAVGINRANMCRLEAGRNPNVRVSLAAALARVLECSIEDLL